MEKGRVESVAHWLSRLLVAGVILAGCADSGSVATSTVDAGGSSTTSAGAGDGGAEITIQNFAFTGATSIPVGTTVTVTNEDGVTHTWTSKDDVWNSGGIRSGDSFEFTFDEPGVYEYFCSIHTQMTGTLTVEG